MSAVAFVVAEARPTDVGKGFARLDPADAARLGVQVGDVVTLTGTRPTVAKIMPAAKELRGHGRIHIDGITRANAGVVLDASVSVAKPAHVATASHLTFAPRGTKLTNADAQFLASKLDGLAVLAGDTLRVVLLGGRALDGDVTATQPLGPVLIAANTELELTQAAPTAPRSVGTSYEDLGGLRREMVRIREMIELPLRYPEVFIRLGIDPPKGVLLYGPPGCGKTQIARAVARETAAHFVAINGPEIIDKMYGASEANLRQVFDEARKRTPAIVFIDEIDAIAPKREEMGGDRQIERRVVAQLLTLMDGLDRRQQVIVIAATNLPDSLDPALRRPGRFDREIRIPVPDRAGRREILAIHSRGMPLTPSVDLDHLAATTHGFVGADLEALCREAAMHCLRRVLPSVDLTPARLPNELLAQLEVDGADFRAALREVEPSAVREWSVDIPDVPWAAVGGLDAVKQQLIEALEWPLKQAELFRQAGVQAPKGILLSGPPGCGKTLLAKAAASQTQVNFLSVKGPALLSKYVGESEKGVREVFKKARQVAPCLIFFDEIDALVPARGGDSPVTDRVIGQFLAELDGVEPLAGVLVLAATNRPDIVDPALLRPGRFDLHVRIPLPDAAGRAEILAINLRAKPIAGPVDVAELATATAGFSGAQLAAVVEHAARAALRRALAEPGTPVQIMAELLHAGVASVRGGA
jgi:transitional endoplasmic reticulum ATPase